MFSKASSTVDFENSLHLPNSSYDPYSPSEQLLFKSVWISVIAMRIVTLQDKMTVFRWCLLLYLCYCTFGILLKMQIVWSCVNLSKLTFYCQIVSLGSKYKTYSWVSVFPLYLYNKIFDKGTHWIPLLEKNRISDTHYQFFQQLSTLPMPYLRPSCARYLSLPPFSGVAVIQRVCVSFHSSEC